MTEHPALDELSVKLLMWILIISELLVFVAGLIAFLSVRITDPVGFAEAQSGLNRRSAGINSIVLITSGFLPAMACKFRQAVGADVPGWHWSGQRCLGWCFCGSIL